MTEEITGVDLVEWQLCVASGEALPKKQDELSINGHAIEARLYAEDPAKGFLPSVGRLERLDLNEECKNLWPESNIRIETGIEEGDTISPHYDPMIAKLVVHSKARDTALSDLGSFLDLTEIWPVRSNAPFLYLALEHNEFEKGEITTGFLQRYGDVLIPDSAPSEDNWALACALNART